MKAGQRPPVPRVLVVAVTLAVLASLLVLLATRLLQTEAPAGVTLSRGTAEHSKPPRSVSTDESYVRTEILVSGDLEVTQWIESAELLFHVDLSIPDIPGFAGVSAQDVRVVANGLGAEGPERITEGVARYDFIGARSVEVRFKLVGAVDPSTSASGRALAPLTSLQVAYEPTSSRVTRTVLATDVLSLACSPSSSAAAPRPCGAPDSSGSWTVELTGDRVDDRLMAQVTLR